MVRRTGKLLVETAETAFAFSERVDCLLQAIFVKVGPMGIGDINLRVTQLPEHEVAEPEFSTGSDKQIGVRDIWSIKIFCKLFLRGLNHLAPFLQLNFN